LAVEAIPVPFGWDTCADPARRQVEGLAAWARSALGASLVGVYLHGSLALGCFNPEASDIDLLVVTADGLGAAARLDLADYLLEHSRSPHPLEISVLTLAGLHSWRHPAPYDFHYSESWRERFLEARGLGEVPPGGVDPDLAAHITVLEHRGICIWGKPIANVFPPVPRHDYLDSVRADLEWSRASWADNPAYAVLNLARTCAFVVTGSVLSKEEGGRWALGKMPKRFEALLSAALDRYAGRGNPWIAVADIEAFSLFCQTEYLEKEP
jgi:predicted nucleotidyltransferase